MYKRTIWVDHVEGAQEGTDMNAANFNKIEAGTMEANALAALNAEHHRYCTDQAEDNKIVTIRAELVGNSFHTITIPDGFTRNKATYRVIPEVSRAFDNGTIGDIEVIEKQVNSFSAAYNGTASSVEIYFHISGGMI